MPIFVSRFSSARAGLANFQFLRTSAEEVSPQERALSQQEQVRGREEDQTGSSGENGASAFGLLVTSQQADQLAQRVTQTAAARTQRASNSRTNGNATSSGSSQAARQAAQASRRASVSVAVSARTTVQQGTQTPRNRTGAQTGQQAQRTQANVNLRPVLRSAVQRLDNLTRLISAQRRGQVDQAQATAEAGRVRLATSLRIEQTAAQPNGVQTAAQTNQAGQVEQTPAQTQPEPRAEDRLRETPALKQNLREDVATVARGLVSDAVLQNAQNARRIAQNTLQAATQRARQRTPGLTHPVLQRTPLSQGLLSSGRRRQSFTPPNLSPLRSALALLGTNVNILVG